MKKTILLIHGRGTHPREQVTRALWLEALRHGIRRDHPHKLNAFEMARKELIYFGDFSNALLADLVGSQPSTDGSELRQTLGDLTRYDGSAFTRKTYRKLPGRNPWKRELADTFAGLLFHLGLSQRVISTVAPDMAHYWNIDSAFGSNVRFPAITPFKPSNVIRRSKSRDTRLSGYIGPAVELRPGNACSVSMRSDSCDAI